MAFFKDDLKYNYNSISNDSPEDNYVQSTPKSRETVKSECLAQINKYKSLISYNSKMMGEVIEKKNRRYKQRDIIKERNKTVIKEINELVTKNSMLIDELNKTAKNKKREIIINEINMTNDKIRKCNDVKKHNLDDIMRIKYSITDCQIDESKYLKTIEKLNRNICELQTRIIDL